MATQAAEVAGSGAARAVEQLRFAIIALAVAALLFVAIGQVLMRRSRRGGGGR